jgi:hypothetical protein
MGMSEFTVDEWNAKPATPTIRMPLRSRFRTYKREHWISDLVRKHGWTRGAELGVWKGRTFLHVLKKCPKLTLIGVDLWEPQPGNDGPEDYIDWPHEQNESFVRDSARAFGKRAIIHKGSTTETATLVEDDSLDFIFVDADHSTEAVRNDILTWWPKVKDTGMIIGHDINWPTVQIVADELLPGYVIGPDNAWGRQKVI